MADIEDATVTLARLLDKNIQVVKDDGSLADIRSKSVFSVEARRSPL